MGLVEDLMGTWERSVVGMDGEGSTGGVSLPAEWRRENNVDIGDNVALRETDDGTLEVVPPEK